MCDSGSGFLCVHFKPYSLQFSLNDDFSTIFFNGLASFRVILDTSQTLFVSVLTSAFTHSTIDLIICFEEVQLLLISTKSVIKIPSYCSEIINM